jgi:UDP-N-acetylglucosamine--N-acetylmuramyl-(pentapeptide) pyrophosphoryl-undecaprenol N-acetylglucosamine transferase
MAREGGAPLILIAAGGTGGHLFPAEALASVLGRRGLTVDLVTDERATRYGSKFPARATHIVASETVRSRNPLSLAHTALMLGVGFLQAYALIARLKPRLVIGFGGYPTVPPLYAATMRRVPTMVHEQNGVMGRANRMLAGRVTAIATGFDGVFDADPQLAAKVTHTGNPVRPAVLAAANTPYAAPEPGGPLRLLVFGGSQGARIMADLVPPAVERLEPALRARIAIVQQAREEDTPRVKDAYARLNVPADVAPFFPDLPARMAGADLVISRSGASTVAELAAIGRPAVLLPLPHALDQDQLANAKLLEKAGGAICLTQDGLTHDRFAAQIAALITEPGRLVAMAQASKSAGAIDAAERLADLVVKTAGIAAEELPSI